MKLSPAALAVIGQIFNSKSTLTIPSAAARVIVEIQDWLQVEAAERNLLEKPTVD